MDQVIQLAKKTLQTLRDNRPLIHVIPNQVSATFCADALAALGARPIMALAPEEVATITTHAHSVVLNMGQPTSEKFIALKCSALAARETSIPVVFDPVGVGASAFRLEGAHSILEIPWQGIIRLNQSEYLALTSSQLTHTGVDALEHLSPEKLDCSFRVNTTFLITGASDYIVSDRLLYEVKHLSAFAPHIVGTGCCLSSICGAFVALDISPSYAALMSSLTLSIASYKASLLTSSYGDYKITLLNQLDALTSQDFEELIPKILTIYPNNSHKGDLS